LRKPLGSVACPRAGLPEGGSQERPSGDDRLQPPVRPNVSALKTALDKGEIGKAELLSITTVGTSIVDPAIGAAGDVDTAVVTLSYADGRIAVIKNSRRAVYGYGQRLDLLGSEGLLQAQNLLGNTVVKSTTAGVTGAKPTYFFLERYMPAYAAGWAAFVAAVNAGSALPVTLADGVAALAEAATQSAKTGLPITLASVSGRTEPLAPAQGPEQTTPAHDRFEVAVPFGPRSDVRPTLAS
jgi:Oxidoreductase family, C-terminal alpha/beta domain